LIITNLGDLSWQLVLAWHVGAIHKQRENANVVFEGELNLDPDVVD
jgi:hypothetical protein